MTHNSCYSKLCAIHLCQTIIKNYTSWYRNVLGRNSAYTNVQHSSWAVLARGAHILSANIHPQHWTHRLHIWWITLTGHSQCLNAEGSELLTCWVTADTPMTSEFCRQTSQDLMNHYHIKTHLDQLTDWWECDQTTPNNVITLTQQNY